MTAVCSYISECAAPASHCSAHAALHTDTVNVTVKTSTRSQGANDAKAAFKLCSVIMVGTFPTNCVD